MLAWSDADVARRGSVRDRRRVALRRKAVLMFKTTIATSALVLAVASVGCASSSESADSSTEAVGATHLISLAEAENQVAAARAKFEPNAAHELLFDTSLAPAYVAAVRPIFEHVAPTDKIPLAGDAFTYVSDEVQVGALLDGGFLTDAVPASYHDLWDVSFYFGRLSSDARFWSMQSGLMQRSKSGPLGDLQVVEIVTVAAPSDVVGGLKALGWSSAPQASAANVRSLVDAPGTFGAVSTLLFGPVSLVPDGHAHDIDSANAFGIQLFEQTFSKLRFVGPEDEGGILVDLGGHLRQAREDAHHEATVGVALAKSALTPEEFQLANL
jgi:hypothetical protein